MNRVIKIYFNDLTADRDECSAMINTACTRHQPMRVTGVLCGDDFLLVNLEDAGPKWRVYNFAPLDGTSAEELSTEITARYYAGFSLECGFMLRGQYWALLSSDPAEQLYGQK